MEEPVLSLCTISFKDWFDGEKWIDTALLAEPPVVTSFSVSIEDRTVLEEMKLEGLERVAQMEAFLFQLAAWLQNNYTLIDITTKNARVL